MRRTILSAKLRDEVCGYIADGVPIATACLAIGISEATFYKWQKRGDEERARLAENPKSRVKKSEAPYVEFVESIARARAQARALRIRSIRQAGAGYPVEQVIEKRERDPKTGREKVVEKRTKRWIERDWRADAYWLDRQDPAFREKTRAEVTHRGDPQAPVQTAGEVSVFHFYIPDNGRRKTQNQAGGS